MSSVIEQKDIVSKVVNPIVKTSVAYSENVYKIEGDGLHGCSFVGCKYDSVRNAVVLLYDDERSVIVDNFLSSSEALLDVPAVVDRFDVVGIPLLKKNGVILPYNDDRLESWVFSSPYVVKLLNDVYSYGDEYVLKYAPERSVFTPAIDVGVVPQDTKDVYADVYFYNPLIIDIGDTKVEEKCISDESGIIEVRNNIVEVIGIKEYVTGKPIVNYTVSNRQIDIGVVGTYVVTYRASYIGFRYDFMNFYELYWSGTNSLNQPWSVWERIENGGRLERYKYYRLWFRMLRGFDKVLSWVKSFSVKIIDRKLYA